MKRDFTLIAALALGTSLTAAPRSTAPQDTAVVRTVVVEQEYAPHISDAAKVNVQPAIAEPTVTQQTVEYATTSTPATSLPADPLRPYVAKESQSHPTPGYVRAGYGNYGNLDLLANYLLRLSPRDKLNLRLQADGMDGKLTVPVTGEHWKAHHYRTRFGANYTHRFEKMELEGTANFGTSHFNYRPNSVNEKQRFLHADAEVRLSSTDETAPLRYHAEAGLLSYERKHNMLNPAGTGSTSISETTLRVGGAVTAAFDDRQTITIGTLLNHYLYSGLTRNVLSGERYFKNHTTLSLNPYYELSDDDWRLHVGAHTDLAFGFGKSVRLTPDITVQYLLTDGYVLYAQAIGGRLGNNFRRLEELCPYAEADAGEGGYARRPYDTYEQVDARLGIKATPLPGLWLHLYGGHQRLKDDLAPTSFGTPSTTYLEYTLRFAQGDTHNSYVGLDASYTYKDFADFTAGYRLRSWKSNGGLQLLAAKPASELRLLLSLRPMSALRLQLGYDYITRSDLEGLGRMAAVSDLHAGATYELFGGIAVYARLHNLLNRTYQYYPGYPAQKFNFLGGMSFRF